MSSDTNSEATGVDRAGEAGDAGEDAGSGGLDRALGKWLLFFFILGDMLGGGIYALVGEVSGEVGGAVWSAFLAAFVLASLTAFAYVELVSKYPRAAGAALYVNLGFKKPFVTFMVAFIVMASGITSASALAKGFAGDYFTEFLDAPVLLVSLVFILVVALINAYGIAESVKMNAIFTCIEVSGLLLIVLIGAVAIGDGSGDFSNNFEWKDDGNPLFLAIAGAALAFYALIGFEDSVNVAEEVKKPAKAYPFALFGGLVVAGLVYVLVTMAASTVVPPDELAGSEGLLEVVRQGPMGISTRLFSAIALFALANGALINMIMASRLLFGMAKEDILPSAFGATLSSRNTPHVAIVFTTILAAILISTGDLGGLASTTVLLLLVVFVMVNIACLVLRSDEVDHDHFRTPTFIPVLGVIVCVGLMTQNDTATLLRAAALIAVGVVLWFVNRAFKGRVDDIDASALGD